MLLESGPEATARVAGPRISESLLPATSLLEKTSVTPFSRKNPKEDFHFHKKKKKVARESRAGASCCREPPGAAGAGEKGPRQPAAPGATLGGAAPATEHPATEPGRCL